MTYFSASHKIDDFIPEDINKKETATFIVTENLTC